MSVGYGVTNLLSGLAATAFTWSSAYTTGRSRLNDGLQDEVAAGSSSAQASGQYLQIDLGSAQSVCAIALLNHNLASGGCSVEVQFDQLDNPAFPSPVTYKNASTINTSAPYQKDTVLQFPAVAKRYWRIVFAHSGTKTVQLGEVLFFGSVTTLSRMPIYGAAAQERYITNRSETRTGHVRTTYLGGPVRELSLPFKDLEGESQRDELLSMWRATQGGVSNLLWIDLIESTSTAATAEGQRCLWGKLQESMGYSESDYRLWDVDGLRLVGLGREVGS